MNEYANLWNWTIQARELAARQLADMCGGSLSQTNSEKYIHNPVSLQS